MALDERYEIQSTASYIMKHGFSRVALQFPDELLADSVAVAAALGNACDSVRLFVMADTTYGSCCVDEVAAAHVNAECVIHYGHSCLSPVASLPVWFVFGRAPVEVECCAELLVETAAASRQPLLVLYDLEYAHAISRLKDAVQRIQQTHLRLTFAEIVGQDMNPSDKSYEADIRTQSLGSERQHIIGGLKWETPQLESMEDYKIVWIGQEGPALTSVMLTYNSSAMVRYDPKTGSKTDLANRSGALQRRYYLIERAKDANIVGIVVGTLGVAGYNVAIQKIKQMVKNAGKKSYTLVVGKPNPAKLANFPECDVFVLVACPQTALVDSKEFLAPLLTPFEAQLAFVRGSEWTGSYCLDFQKLEFEADGQLRPQEEPRFSFLKGGYVASEQPQSDTQDEGKALVVNTCSSKALSLVTNAPDPKSASAYFQLRTFQGLKLESTTTATEEESQVAVFDYRAVAGRKGRAAVYEHEPGN